MGSFGISYVGCRGHQWPRQGSGGTTGNIGSSCHDVPKCRVAEAASPDDAGLCYDDQWCVGRSYFSAEVKRARVRVLAMNDELNEKEKALVGQLRDAVAPIVEVTRSSTGEVGFNQDHRWRNNVAVEARIQISTDHSSRPIHLTGACPSESLLYAAHIRALPEGEVGRLASRLCPVVRTFLTSMMPRRQWNLQKAIKMLTDTLNWCVAKSMWCAWNPVMSLDSSVPYLHTGILSSVHGLQATRVQAPSHPLG